MPKFLSLQYTMGQSLDHHHSFMVQYKPNEDKSLDMHIDDSEITFNININSNFKGSYLTICGLTGDKNRRNLTKNYDHKLGRCLVHAGSHRHGAKNIISGERMNIIIWCKSSSYRQYKSHGSGNCVCCKVHKNENNPDLLCLSKTHDKDYKKWVKLLQNNNDNKI